METYQANEGKPNVSLISALERIATLLGNCLCSPVSLPESFGFRFGAKSEAEGAIFVSKTETRVDVLSTAQRGGGARAPKAFGVEDFNGGEPFALAGDANREVKLCDLPRPLKCSICQIMTAKKEICLQSALV